ncbi:hypothetical protein A2U01_0055376, partial [Trifolium medium]|nr:hypothetical protein [Trifolium medium]
MVAQVLKAKYYPKHNFLEAEIGNKNVSYTWRSISKASWILKKGGLWNIGNGANINIWNDGFLGNKATKSGPLKEMLLKFGLKILCSLRSGVGTGNLFLIPLCTLKLNKLLKSSLCTYLDQMNFLGQ